MLYQQNAIATYLSDIEEAKKQAQEFNTKYLQQQPRKTILSLRNQQVQFSSLFY